MDHATHTKLMDSELTEENLLDAAIYDQDDRKVGTVSRVHDAGVGKHVVVDVGGFLGIGTKPVALMTNQLSFMRDEDGTVHATTTWTKEQVNDMPEHVD